MESHHKIYTVNNPNARAAMSFTVERKPGLLKLDSGNRFRSLERRQRKQGPPQVFIPHPRYRPLLDPWGKDDMFKGRVVQHVQHVWLVFFHLIILTMILISSLHCTISILKVILIRNCLNRRNLTLFLMTLRHLIY